MDRKKTVYARLVLLTVWVVIYVASILAYERGQTLITALLMGGYVGFLVGNYKVK